MSLPLTVPMLLAIMPGAGEAASTFLMPLQQSMARWGIADSDARVAAFLAQVAHESDDLTALEENLNYSAEGLLKTWPNRFSAEAAAHYARKPELIANRVYANRMGNGDQASGDGWRYRGRGLFQLTGKKNYAAASLAICGDASVLVKSPELVVTPEYACETAGWYWHDNDLDRFADTGDFDGLTRAINGGLNGLKERVAYWHRSIEALA